MTRNKNIDQRRAIELESSKEIINEVKSLTPEIYKDFAKPTLQEVGSVTGRTVKALLSPLRGLLWGWERIEELVESEVKKRLDTIPEEKRKSPDPEIAVPLLQALTYTARSVAGVLARLIRPFCFRKLSGEDTCHGL